MKKAVLGKVIHPKYYKVLKEAAQQSFEQIKNGWSACTSSKTQRRSFFYEKSWNGKRYLFANVNYFRYLTFCYFDRANSIKIALWSVSYKFVNWFWLNLPNWNSKKFSTSKVKSNSHLQMDIFCHFDLCHCRRNTFQNLKDTWI